ncbi:orexin receptor type 2-like [Saccoglossus kowalevskii]
MNVVSMSVSVLTLSAIAVDRYFAICQPLMFKTTARRALTTILIIWVVSFIIPIPQSVMHVTEPTTHADSPFSYLSLTKCYEKLWQETIQQKIYHVVLVCIIYIIPLSMVTVAYILVCKQLWAAIPGSERCDRKSSPTKNGVVNRPAENQILSRRKVAKMLIIVAVIFAVCYLPLHLLNIIRQFPSVFEFVDDLSQRDVFHVPFLVAHWLAYANSATNPIIYNFLSAKFRKEFRAAFACCCLSRQSRARRGRRGGYRSSYFASTSKSYGVSTTEQITLSSLRRSSDKVRV